MEVIVFGGVVVVSISAVMGLIVMLVVWSQRQGQRNLSKWAETASSMGLEHKPGAWGVGTIEGGFHGFWVRIDTFARSTGKSSTTYTRVRTYHHPPLGLGLQIYREGIFSGLGRALGMQDIATGDGTFDGRFVVKGNEPSRVLTLLNLEARGRMMEYDQRVGPLSINDECVYHEEVGIVTNPDRLKWISEAQVVVAKAMREAQSSSGLLLGE